MAVTITKPASGAELKGVVQVTATFSGQRFDIATVTIDGKQVGSDKAQPIAFSVDTKKVVDGNHTLGVAVRYKTAAGKLRWQKASVPIKVRNATAPAWTRIADEYQNFTLTVATEVRYGTGTTWSTKTLAPGTWQCGNPLFGDPLPGAIKHCERRSGPPPAPLPFPLYPLTSRFPSQVRP